MTHRRIRTLEDGTRVYADYQRYKPVAPADRKYAVRKPDDPEAVRFGSTWYPPLPVLPEDQRVMPETRPDSLTLEHRARCTCEVCQRPGAAELWRRRHASKKGRVVPAGITRASARHPRT